MFKICIQLVKILSLEDSFKETLFFLLSILLNGLLLDDAASEDGSSVDRLTELGRGGVDDALLDGGVSERLLSVSNLLTTGNDGLTGLDDVDLRRGQALLNLSLSNRLDGDLRDIDLGDFLSRLVNDLLFDGLVFDSFLDSFGGNVFNVSVLVDLRNVFSLVFDGVVVGDLLFLRNVFNSLDGFVFNDGLFVGDVFDSRFTLDDFSLDGGGDGNARNLDTGLVENSTGLDGLGSTSLNQGRANQLSGRNLTSGGVDGLSVHLGLNQRLLLNVMEGVLQNLGLNGLLLLI